VTTPFNSLESLRIVEHSAAILASAGVPRAAAVNAIQAVGQLSSGAVLLEAFWSEHAAAGGQVYLSPPLLPHPELPVLSEAVAAGDFLVAGAVFEFGLGAIVDELATLIPEA
jgi:hypothetical protein